MDIFEKIENDDFYGQFLATEARAMSTQAISFTAQITKLAEGIDLLNKELQRQVLENHDDLLRQASHASKLENVLNTMTIHIKNLFANAERLRAQITIPYDQLEAQTKILARLHRASHILRQVGRVQQLSKRLSNTNDPIQKASLLQELEQLAKDPELTDIDAVTAELRNVRVQQQKVVKLATGSLKQGIINENSVQVSTALQIFINLGLIKSTIDELVEQQLNECKEVLMAALDTGAKSASGRLHLSSSQGFRAKMWTELERVFGDEIFTISKQMKFLEVILEERNIRGVERHTFWPGLGEVIKHEIRVASPAVIQSLEADYPKLLKNYHEMVKKLNYTRYEFDRSVLKGTENSYLSLSLTKILDPVQTMFGEEGTVPTHDQIDSLIRILTSEISVALVEQHLTEQVSRNVGKCINMFVVKTEQCLETGPESAQVIGGSPNSGQQKNCHYANALYYLKLQVKRMLGNMKDTLPTAGMTIIEENLRNLDVLTGAIIQPIIVSINSVVETIMVTMHLEPDWSKNTCSPYMKELTQFLNRVYNAYLTPFQDKDVLSDKCNAIALRCIELLVRHSSILRPVSQSGRQRLQIDYRQMEEALKVICPQLTGLGRPYRLLKSMATLITQRAEEIVAGHSPGSCVPYSTILLMLFAFAGPELTSPHQNTGWSLPKLSSWLDEHQKESERLDLVAGALQKYESFIRMKNSINYDPIYPIMSAFLERAIKEQN